MVSGRSRPQTLGFKISHYTSFLLLLKQTSQKSKKGLCTTEVKGAARSQVPKGPRRPELALDWEGPPGQTLAPTTPAQAVPALEVPLRPVSGRQGRRWPQEYLAPRLGACWAVAHAAKQLGPAGGWVLVSPQPPRLRPPGQPTRGQEAYLVKEAAGGHAVLATLGGGDDTVGGLD